MYVYTYTSIYIPLPTIRKNYDNCNQNILIQYNNWNIILFDYKIMNMKCITYSINIPTVKEIEISRCLCHQRQETPSRTPMCGNGDPYRSWQKYWFPRYFRFLFVNRFRNVVHDIIFFIVGDSRMLLRRVVHEKSP